MNISEKNNAFLWLPAKTGSNHATKIFSHFDFFKYSVVNGEIKLSEISSNHGFLYPTNYENYIFICTARNPFTTILSQYKFNNKNPNLWNPKDFKSFFDKNLVYENVGRQFFPFTLKTPDFFIRTENLYEDYSKIDFIKKSEYFQSGELEKFCKLKINGTESILNPHEYFSNDMIDYILYVGKEYFELLNYSYPF